MYYLYFLFIIIFCSGELFSQDSSKVNILFEVNKRVKFADNLFCTKDYLRAAEEYRKIYPEKKTDTIKYKIALSYFKSGDYLSAYSIFSNFREKSLFYAYARQNMFKIYFLNKQFELLEYESAADKNKPAFTNVPKLILASKFLTDCTLPPFSEYQSNFSEADIKQVNRFYAFKQNPPLKNKLTAGLMSLFPGLGKVYVEQYGDGITAFLATSALTALAVTNFNANHNFRGWLFSGLATAFYGGSIYGSVAAVPIYNAKIYFDFNKSVNSFIEENNYFLSDYGFCK